MGAEFTSADFQNDDQFLSGLEQTTEFNNLKAKVQTVVSKTTPRDTEPYRLKFWYPGQKELYVTSGHYAKYGADSFQPIHTPKEGEEFFLKPMN